MDGCVLLTSTPECVVSPRGETTHSGVDVNNTHPSMINPLNVVAGSKSSFLSLYDISNKLWTRYLFCYEYAIHFTQLFR